MEAFIPQKYLRAEPLSVSSLLTKTLQVLASAHTSSIMINNVSHDEPETDEEIDVNSASSSTFLISIHLYIFTKPSYIIFYDSQQSPGQSSRDDIGM